MAIFNSYVSLPEGNTTSAVMCRNPLVLEWNSWCFLVRPRSSPYWLKAKEFIAVDSWFVPKVKQQPIRMIQNFLDRNRGTNGWGIPLALITQSIPIIPSFGFHIHFTVKLCSYPHAKVLRCLVCTPKIDFLPLSGTSTPPANIGPILDQILSWGASQKLDGF